MLGPESPRELCKVRNGDRARRRAADLRAAVRDIDVRLRGLEAARREPDQLTASVFGGGLHCRADGKVILLRRPSPPTARRRCRSIDYVDRLHGHAQRLRGDLRNGGRRTADVDRADEHLYPAVGVHPHTRARRLKAAEPSPIAIPTPSPLVRRGPSGPPRVLPATRADRCAAIPRRSASGRPSPRRCADETRADPGRARAPPRRRAIRSRTSPVGPRARGRRRPAPW